MVKVFRNFLFISILMSFMSMEAQTGKGTIVVLKSEYGNMKIKLYDETPLHRDNFLKLVRDGYYKDLLFHRVIKGFMIQGGDPDSKNAPAGKQLGAGDVGYTIPAEIVYPKFYHKKGALAAARTADQVNPERRSSGCQFYIVQGKKMNAAELENMEKQLATPIVEKRFYELVNENSEKVKELRKAKDQQGLMALQQKLIAQAEEETKDSAPKMTEQMKIDYSTVGGTPFLDNQYTVFGEVVEGLDVVDKIAGVATSKGDRPVNDVKFEIVME